MQFETCISNVFPYALVDPVCESLENAFFDDNYIFVFSYKVPHITCPELLEQPT